MTNTNGNGRPANPKDAQGFPPDRRVSCRYPVAEVPALLSWWELESEIEEQPEPIEPAPHNDPLAELTPAEANIYVTIMGRGPTLGKNGQTAAANDGFESNAGLGASARHANPFLTCKRGTMPFLQNAKPANPSLANGNSAVALVPQAGTAIQPTPERVAAPVEEEDDEVEEPVLRTTNARILDISQSGISLLCEDVPHGDPSVWVRLDGEQPTDWVESSIRASSLKEHGLYLIRLEFRDVCPYDFFKAAVYGYFGA